MLDGLRTIACYALVASILGGLWAYAVLQQRISVAKRHMFPPAKPALLQRVRGIANNEAWRDPQQPRPPGKNATAITRVETGE